MSLASHDSAVDSNKGKRGSGLRFCNSRLSNSHDLDLAPADITTANARRNEFVSKRFLVFSQKRVSLTGG